MRGFSANDLRTFSDGVAEIYAAGDVEALSRAALGVLTSLVSCDGAVFGEQTQRGAFRSSAFMHPDPQTYLRHEDAYHAYRFEHPINRYYTATADGSAVTLDEVAERAAWQRTGLYNEFFRPLRIESLLSCAFSTEAMPYVGIGLARDGRDFSGRDRLVMNLLRPHVRRAYEKVAPSRDVETRRVRLTPRELEVLSWTAAGKTNGQIGIILETSARTVQKHLEHVFQKLSVETRTAAVVRAIELKLIEPVGDGP